MPISKTIKGLAQKQGLRFIVAGGLASTVNWISRFPLSLLLSFEVAVALAYLFGTGVGFVLYRSWVFKGRRGHLWQQVPRFLLVNAFGLAVVMLSASEILSLLASVSGLSSGSKSAVAHSLALIIGAVVNFVGHRSLTFGERRV